MKKFYLLFLCLFLGFIHSRAQESCSQSFGGSSGKWFVPFTTNDDESNMIAIDIDVAAGTNFTLKQIETTIDSMVPFGYSYVVKFYTENLNNEVGTSQTLSVAQITSVSQGTWKLSFDLPNPVILNGGTAGAKFWIAVTAIQEGASFASWHVDDYTVSTNKPLLYSNDGGISWSSQIEGFSTPVEGLIKLTGTCEIAPITTCSQSVASNNFESGGNINANWSRAVDLVVAPNQDFLLKQMLFNVYTATESNITSVDIYFYKDNNGLPGELISSQLGIVPADETIIGQMAQNDVKKITLNLTPIEFTGQLGENTHYWVRVNATNSVGGSIWWETTSVSTVGYKMVNYYDNKWSTIWEYEGVYEFKGECLPFDITTACNTNFYDSGNTTSDYGNNENKTWNIIPEAGKAASVEFISFATEAGMDGLMVYDGPDTSYPIISSGFKAGNTSCPNGAWTGTGEYSAQGQTFISSHSSGILTFVFTSNDTNTATGWEADVKCVSPGSAGNCLPGNLETPFPANSSGLGASMFNITSRSDKDLEIRKFDLHMTSGKKTIEVYYRPGSYEGHEQDPSGWTLLGSQETIGKGAGKRTELKIGGLVIPAGQTYGIYITMADYVLGEGITFPFNSIDNNTYSNDKLEITPGVTMPGGYFSDLSYLENIVWQGIIHYCEGGTSQEYEQPCLNAEYGQFPSYVYEPQYYGYREAITKTGWRGEYSLVKVIKNKEYSFSSSSTTDFITLSDELGVLALASGTGTINWTADFDGIVRFYTHTNDSCGQNNSSQITRYVQSGTKYTPQNPDFPCYFGDGLQSQLQYGTSVQLGGQWMAADDFTVNEDFKIKQIRINVLSDAPVTDARFSIYKNHLYDEGVEGPNSSTLLYTSPMIVPSSQIALGNHGEISKFYELSFDLPEEITIKAGKHWLMPEINGVNAYWEVTPSGSTGNDIIYTEDFNSDYWWNSYEGMQGVFFISGECGQMATNDIQKSDLTYYPNPVENILNLKTMKKITSVEIFGITGQKMITQSKLQDQQIDMSSLTAGVYIVQIQTEGGRTEAFKIIKK